MVLQSEVKYKLKNKVMLNREMNNQMLKKWKHGKLG